MEHIWRAHLTETTDRAAVMASVLDRAQVYASASLEAPVATTQGATVDAPPPPPPLSEGDVETAIACLLKTTEALVELARTPPPPPSLLESDAAAARTLAEKGTDLTMIATILKVTEAAVENAIKGGGGGGGSDGASENAPMALGGLIEEHRAICAMMRRPTGVDMPLRATAVTASPTPISYVSSAHPLRPPASPLPPERTAPGLSAATPVSPSPPSPLGGGAAGVYPRSYKAKIAGASLGRLAFAVRVFRVSSGRARMIKRSRIQTWC